MQGCEDLIAIENDIEVFDVLNFAQAATVRPNDDRKPCAGFDPLYKTDDIAAHESDGATFFNLWRWHFGYSRVVWWYQAKNQPNYDYTITV